MAFDKAILFRSAAASLPAGYLCIVVHQGSISMYSRESQKSHPSPELMFPAFAPELMRKLAAYGTEAVVITGTTLFTRGTRGADFFVVLSGRVEISETRSGRMTSIMAHLSEGQFTGEMDLLNNRETLLDCIAVSPAVVLRIKRDEFRRLIRTEPDIAEMITAACILRRSELIQESLGGILLLGKRSCGPSMLLQRFLLRNNYPHRFLDLDSEEEASELFEGLGLSQEHLPVAVLPEGKILHHPGIIAVADSLGLSEPATDDIFDVAIVGAGPAGLAAAVYASSEGLKSIVIEGNAPGGQAGASSKIENYLGFPVGITGQELAERAQVQAQKFGTTLAISRNVIGLRKIDARVRLLLEDGTNVSSYVVVIATGARYRKLNVPRYEFYETQGIHYAATQMEAAICTNKEVVIVGGGNSAGQAAVFLSHHSAHVHLLIRSDSLGLSMSDYLVQRIMNSEKITVYTRSRVVALSGEGILEGVSWQRDDGLLTSQAVQNLFVMIGAHLNTDWLKNTIDLDINGFVQTDPTQGSTYATSVPGVFAVGDVRAKSIKRVASAVGEGAAVVADIHSYLANRPPLMAPATSLSERIDSSAPG